MTAKQREAFSCLTPCAIEIKGTQMVCIVLKRQLCSEKAALNPASACRVAAITSVQGPLAMGTLSLPGLPRLLSSRVGWPLLAKKGNFSSVWPWTWPASYNGVSLVITGPQRRMNQQMTHRDTLPTQRASSCTEDFTGHSFLFVLAQFLAGILFGLVSWGARYFLSLCLMGNSLLRAAGRTWHKAPTVSACPLCHF
jgi:hypothetical protein